VTSNDSVSGGGSLKVRPATRADCTDIYQVHINAMRRLQVTSPSGKGVDDYIDSRNPSVYAEEMETQQFVVVERDKQVVGFGALHVAKKEITMVFVNPAHQRNGVGRTVLRELEKRAREANLTGVHLQATGTAIEFYAATGYQSDPPVKPGAAWAVMKKSV